MSIYNLSFYIRVKSAIRDFSNKYFLLKKFYNFLFFWKWRVYFLKNFYRRDVEGKTIFFESFMGKSFADSPKAIYLELIGNEKYKDYTFIWSFTNPESYIEEPLLARAKLIKRNTKPYYEALSSSKYWVSNSRMYDFLARKEEQVYLQTWHGTPFKKIGFDIVKGDNANHSENELKLKYKRESNLFTHILSPSKYCSEKLISSFDIEQKEKVLELGYPRNDFLKNFTDCDVESIKEKLNIPENKRVVFYAPTWRDNQHVYGLGYTFNSAVDFNKLCSSLGDDVILLVRFHYFVTHGLEGVNNPSIIDVSNYPDINDLYIVSDLLITDYSSVFFDYALLDRPIIFYMYDLNEYANDLRGFYFSPDLLPGEVIQSEENLSKSIMINLLEDSYAEIRKEWIQKFSYLDDGQSAKRVVDHVFSKN